MKLLLCIISVSVLLYILLPNVSHVHAGIEADKACTKPNSSTKLTLGDQRNNLFRFNEQNAYDLFVQAMTDGKAELRLMILKEERRQWLEFCIREQITITYGNDIDNRKLTVAVFSWEKMSRGRAMELRELLRLPASDKLQKMKNCEEQLKTLADGFNKNHERVVQESERGSAYHRKQLEIFGKIRNHMKKLVQWADQFDLQDDLCDLISLFSALYNSQNAEHLDL